MLKDRMRILISEIEELMICEAETLNEIQEMNRIYPDSMPENIIEYLDNFEEQLYDIREKLDEYEYELQELVQKNLERDLDKDRI